MMKEISPMRWYLECTNTDPITFIGRDVKNLFKKKPRGDWRITSFCLSYLFLFGFFAFHVISWWLETRPTL